MDNNTVLEIRQRTADLMRQAMLIWQSGVHSDNLEGLENDPVFQMLMTAMAYQFNEIDSNLESIKQQVMSDFAEILMPYNFDGAIPSSFVMQCQPAEGVADITLTGDSVFMGRGSNIPFIPLLQTRVLNASVDKIVRLDGRRWKVSILFPESVTSLVGFAFTINDLIFRDVVVSLNDMPIHLIKPWDQHDLPLTEPFDFFTRLYNQTPVFNAVSLCMDILARQDVCLLCVGEQASSLSFPEETHCLDFVFEFFGISEDFVLDKSKLHLNTNILVNAQVNTASLSKNSPVARISGVEGQKFLKLLSPPKDQVPNQYRVSVRRVMAERFNLGSLIRLLDCLISKYHSDFYAFQLLRQHEGEAAMNNLLMLMKRLREQAASNSSEVTGGLFLFLSSEDEKVVNIAESFDVRYLTTNGTINESVVADDAKFSTPVGIDMSTFRIIAKPVIGSDGNLKSENKEMMVSYYVSTSDRIVTPADIRIFCMATLANMLSLSSDMFRYVTISHKLSQESSVGYVIEVDICLVNSVVIRKTIGERIPRLECLLENLLRVRSINIYPFKVIIQLK